MHPLDLALPFNMNIVRYGYKYLDSLILFKSICKPRLYSSKQWGLNTFKVAMTPIIYKYNLGLFGLFNPLLSESKCISDYKSKAGNLKCWNCQNKFHNFDLKCQNCDCLVDSNLAKDLDYFIILGETFTFDFEKNLLTKRLKKIQSILHPDKTINKSKNERHHSEELSALVNKAFDTLSNPLLRGLYMLELLGTPLEEGTTDSNSDFLMEVMEMNEALIGASDTQLRNISEKNKATIISLGINISNAFENKNYQKAKELLAKMKFYNNIRDKIKTQSFDFD